MKVSRYFFLFLFLLQLPLMSFAAKQSARKIMEKTFDLEKDYKDYESKNTLILIDKRKNKISKKLTIKKIKYGSTSKMYIKVLEPRDIYGMKFLIWDFKRESKDSKWVFLPASNLVRRISSQEKNRSFLGSDFNYKDLEMRDVDDATHKLLGVTRVNNREVYIVESTLKKADVYSKFVSYIDKKLYIALKTEYYDLRGRLQKVGRTLAVKRFDKKWTVVKSKMDNIKQKHSTYFIVDSIKYDNGFKRSFFNKRILRRD